MHQLFEHLCKQLGDRLKKRRVVLFYDLRREFEPFIEEMAPEPGPSAEVERVTIDGLEVHLARFKGSFFAVRFAVEDLVAVDLPEPLLVCLPGAERDPKTSVLMELEKAGTTYEPQLKRLARNMLRQVYTDGDIDEMLKPETLGYRDVVAYAKPRSRRSGSTDAREKCLAATSRVPTDIWKRWLRRDRTTYCIQSLFQAFTEWARRKVAVREGFRVGAGRVR